MCVAEACWWAHVPLYLTKLCRCYRLACACRREGRGGVRSAPHSYHNSPVGSPKAAHYASTGQRLVDVADDHNLVVIPVALYESVQSGMRRSSSSSTALSSPSSLAASTCYGIPRSPSAVFSRSQRDTQRSSRDDSGDVAQVRGWWCPLLGRMSECPV